MRPLHVLIFGGTLLVLVAAAWFLDARLVPDIQDCDPSTYTTEAEWRRCVYRESGKVEPTYAYLDRVRWWRRGVALIAIATAVALAASLLQARFRSRSS